MKKIVKRGKRKAETKPLKMVKCSDCGSEFAEGAPHRMFCDARTCRVCGTTFGYVLPVYDSRPEALDDAGRPERRCDRCIEEGNDE